MSALTEQAKNLKKHLIELERRELSKDFGRFFEDSWSEVMEPGTELAPSWHYEYLSEWLTLLGTGEFRRRWPKKKGLIINIPPRTAKSLMCTVAFPAWLWTFAPNKKIMAISYGSELAIPLSVKRRELIESQWYQQRWNVRLKDDENLKQRQGNTKSGYIVAGTPGGTITGVGGDVIIVDDPLKADSAYSETERVNANNFYDNTLRSRLNSPTEGVFLVVMQRLHQEDFTGHLLSSEPGEWEHVSIPLVEEEEKPEVPVSDLR